MSTVHLPPSQRSNVPDQQSTVQKLLDENSRLIDIIREYQNQSRADEAVKHQHVLHRNLVHLANLADPYLIHQLRDDLSPQADPAQPLGNPHVQPAPVTSQQHIQQSQQPPQSSQSHHSQGPSHHHSQMMPPQAAPSPNGPPGGPIQPSHGFAPPPLNGSQDMMNHHAFQAQMRAQQQQQGGPPVPQGYPPFGQPAPQMGGQRMPYPYPHQGLHELFVNPKYYFLGMSGYQVGPPPHGYEGYPPPGSQPPPQGYMR
ncbi:Protein CBG12192 [Caenorhabditis briggsae]|uniref:Protein CBG12192 n=1 Tax=Caenorhabditis briggsae TaxID=6238 RepID=G2J667_CAEBR|nr:Protein CBG23931 [Caenorhabditis briggsae]XP_045094798.1 Protein CBG12192 [Caenorhabditis briggsae]CAP20661.2 Protein CBG23931 [Caenorhabditis briggsae]CAP31233.2 Protein CBG12192 [Caenorhabditis briggsae]